MGAAEPSHAAAAQSVAEGSADAALGLASAVRAPSPDFVPLTLERPHLVCTKASLGEPAVRALTALLEAPGWQQRLAALAGYEPADSGQVLSLRKVLS